MRETKTVNRYSDSFKRQVVNELEQGKTSIGRLRQKYGIKGQVTIQNWIKSYGRLHLLHKIVRIETMDERDELKAARQRIRELEHALADTHIELVYQKNLNAVICERNGLNKEAEIKKAESGRLNKP